MALALLATLVAPAAGSTGGSPGVSPESPGSGSLDVRAAARDVRTGSTARDLLAAPADPRVAEFQAIADEMVGTISGISYLGRDLTAQVVVSFLPERSTFASMAMTMAENARGGWISSGDMERCLIVVYPDGQALVGEDRRLLMALEVFNCFQMDLTTVEDDADRWMTSGWLTSGASLWAAKELAPGSGLLDRHWLPWVLHPEIPLFARRFDALGFFAHMSANRASPWDHVDRMLLAATNEGNPAAFDVAVEGSPGNDLIDTWGPSYLSLLLPKWEFVGRGIPPRRAEATIGSVRTGETFNASVAPYAALPIELEVTAEIVEMSSASRGRALFSDVTEHDLASLHLTAFCTLPGGCACPRGSPRQDATFEPMPAGDLYIGMTGHHWGGELQMVGWTRNEYCGQAREFDPCLVGTWSSLSFPIVAPGFGVEDGAGVTLTFDAEGGYVMDFSTMDDAVIDAAGDEVILRLDGMATGRAEAVDGSLRSLEGDSSGVLLTVSMDLAGTTIFIWDHAPFEEAFEGIAEGAGQTASLPDTTYRCGPEALEYDTIAPGVVIALTRVR